MQKINASAIKQKRYDIKSIITSMKLQMFNQTMIMLSIIH